MNISSPNLTDNGVISQTVEQIVADRFGIQSVIHRIERERCAYVGSYDCDLITAHLSTGERFRLFLKDYRVSQKSKDEPDQRRERELGAYRDILSQTDLGNPEYYGSIWDNSEGRFWIFLEYVEGVIIKDHNLEHDMLAAEWLGKMQGFFLQHPDILNSCDFLIHQDGEFFRSKASLALWNVSQISRPSASQLARIVDSYDQIIEVLDDQPRTLVHGAYIPWHILLDFNQEPTRVCAIDWELAAFGPVLYDLAYFTDGMNFKSRNRVFNAYRRAARQYKVPLTDRKEMQFIVDCIRLHRIFDWLSRGLEKQFTVSKVEKLVSMAKQLSMLIPV
jgi:hypothetical protein